MISEANIRPWKRPPRKNYLFKHASVVNVVDGTIRADSTVRVMDGRIAEVTESSSSSKNGPTDDADGFKYEEVDCTGKFLCPGLMDMHVHFMAVPGFDNLSQAFGNPNDVSVLRQPYVAAQMLHRGFTTVRDCGGAKSALKDAIADGVFPGPRLFVAVHALSQSGGHSDFRGRHDDAGDDGFCRCGATRGSGRVVNGVAACMQAVREEVRQGADFIKIMAGGGVSSPTDAIDHVQFTGAEVRAMVECAANANTWVTAHAYTPRAILHCIDNGVRGIEHGNLLDEDTARRMAEKGCFLTPTLVTYDQMASDRWKGYLPPASVAKNEQVLKSGLEAVRIAHAAGVTLCYGTDLLGPLSQAQTREFTLRAQVLPALAVLQTATINAARLLRTEGEMGQIRKGFLADMLLLASNPLDDVTILDRPEEKLLMVMKDGRVEKSRWKGVAEDDRTVHLRSTL
jgi:imidazolonepropionase-like amidohydrolase